MTVPVYTYIIIYIIKMAYFQMSSTVFVAGSRLNCDRRSSLSADAQIVWDALVKKHEQRIKTQNTHCKPGRVRQHGGRCYFFCQRNSIFQLTEVSTLPLAGNTVFSLGPLSCLLDEMSRFFI